MPRAAKGPRLYLVAARRNAEGRVVVAARWVIRDGTKMLTTGCGESDVAGAHQALADYIRAAHRPARSQRGLDDISVADVLNIYATDHVAQHPDRHRIAQRLQRLLDWWGGKTLAQVTGATCRAYATHRGNAGGARRDLQDLSAAIGHHHREGYHREIVKVALPKRGEARDRWLSRSEVARLVWTMWRAREGSRADGKAGNTTEGRHTMRHLARFVLLAYSTASRPGAVLTASWEAAAGRSYVDLDKGVFYRLREGARETNKRQPPVRLPRSILAHLRRWRRLTNSESGFVVEWRGQPVARVKVGFANAVKMSGLGEGVSPHTLRHSAVTHLMQQGVPTWEVAGFAGMGEAVLRRHYAHHHPDHMGAAVSAMGATQKRYRLA
ncbi:Integrase family protein [Methylorubrum aminovorans]